MPGYDVLVINDGSSDQTARVARERGAVVLDLPHNVGVGGCVQAGFIYASGKGYDYVIRCDGDGQHPPEEMPKLIAGMEENDVDLVIGSRFLLKDSYMSTPLRYMGIRCLSRMVSVISSKRVTDPTSGFQMLNRYLLYYFARRYPADYPEPEAIALLRRQGYDFCEVPATFRKRVAGVSTIQGWGTFYYMIKVGLALLVDRARRVDVRFSKSNLVESI